MSTTNPSTLCLIPALAGDSTPTEPVLAHVLASLREAEGYRPDLLVRALVMDWARSVDLDDLEDLALAEQLLRAGV